MNLVEIRRENTKFVINQNPRTIQIERKKWVIDKGARYPITEELEPITVRIYTKGGTPTPEQEVQYERYPDRYYSMLADHNADIQAGVEVTDIFHLGGAKYKIIGVWEQTIHGEVVGYQCDLERVV